MYTIAQVAERLQVDADIVRGWCRSGKLRAINVGRGKLRPRFRIDPADLVAFEANLAVGPPPPRAKRRRKRDRNITEFF
ncbi:MAG: helix-turn-helix domain-containing protein [Planctomycetes bacterium]|nr:helix-turn-helix domain-containing protein [Planctomycetota bacterium]